VEVAIADDGEILTRGPHVMLGYWNQPAATAEVLRDGWLYTGDLGVMEDGYLRITGRKKEIIALASGKKVAPALVERLLCEDPLIAQAAVFGESQKYLVALIVPEVSRWQALAQQRGNTDGISSSIADLLTADWVRATLRQRIDRRLADLADCEQVGPFALLDRPFSIEQGEMTVTLKLRRGIIARHFAETIASLYTSPAVGQ
jgi:long-chain acyl-CoA synthetase